MPFAVLCITVLSSVWSIQAAAWVDNLYVLTWVAALGAVWGFLLARARLSSILVHFVGIIIGTLIIVSAVARTLSDGSATARTLELWHRLDEWLGVWASGGISTDNLLFLLLLATLVWLIAYYGAWSVFRVRGPWWVILASGSMLVVNLSYAHNLDLFALLFMVSAMLLIACVHVAVQKDDWRRGDVEYPADFAWKLLRSSLVAGVLVIVLVWMAPGTTGGQQLAEAWTRVGGPWQDAEGEFSRMFGGLQVKDQSNASAFGRTLALRGATSLGDSPVLLLTAEEPYYLRGVVYDRYTGQGWIASDRGSQQLRPNDPRLAGDGSNLLLRDEVTTTVKVLQPRGTTVMAPAQPLMINVPTSAEYDVSSEQNGGAGGDGVTDVTLLRSTAMLRQGLQYVAVSSVTRANAKSLRSSGTIYPAWVTERYLSLSETAPRRILVEARRITRSARTPFDKAIALQSFLRSLPYSNTVQSPPPGRDAVDFFLFDSKVGYCDYYASAMVVMLRGLGVPARVVSGYSPGKWDSTQQGYVVRDANAHSWPEVYFPRYGWVQFEPTASLPTLTLPEETAAEPVSSVTTDPPLTPAEEDNPPDLSGSSEGLTLPAVDLPESGSDLLTIGRFAASALALIVLACLGFRLLWWRIFRGLTPAESTYSKMAFLASMAGVRRLPHQTPHEHGARIAGLVPEGGGEIQLIVEQFARQRFGRQALRGEEEASLRHLWHRVRKLLGRRALSRMLGLGRYRRME